MKFWFAIKWFTLRRWWARLLGRREEAKHYDLLLGMTLARQLGQFIADGISKSKPREPRVFGPAKPSTEPESGDVIVQNGG